MLLTLNVELEEPAIAFAIDSAAEAGAELYICDAIPLEYRNYVGHVARQYAEQMNRKHLDAVARRARDQGVTTTQLAFHNPKPVKTALEVAQDRAHRPACLRRQPEGARKTHLPEGCEADPREPALPGLGPGGLSARNSWRLQA